MALSEASTGASQSRQHSVDGLTAVGECLTKLTAHERGAGDTCGSLVRAAMGLLAAPTRALQRRSRSVDDSAAVGECPELTADEWEIVAEQLRGVEGRSLRGVLRGVCRAARVGVDRAAATLEDGRRMDLRMFASRFELLAWASWHGCGSVDGERVQKAAVEAGGLDILQWGVQWRSWTLSERICGWAARARHLALLQWVARLASTPERCGV
eukprot:jgi/Tetstr1/424568/TSEL_015094.t1